MGVPLYAYTSALNHVVISIVTAKNQPGCFSCSGGKCEWTFMTWQYHNKHPKTRCQSKTHMNVRKERVNKSVSMCCCMWLRSPAVRLIVEQTQQHYHQPECSLLYLCMNIYGLLYCSATAAGFSIRYPSENLFDCTIATFCRPISAFILHYQMQNVRALLPNFRGNRAIIQPCIIMLQCDAASAVLQIINCMICATNWRVSLCCRYWIMNVKHTLCVHVMHGIELNSMNLPVGSLKLRVVRNSSYTKPLSSPSSTLCTI